jgi:hypothetical protein
VDWIKLWPIVVTLVGLIGVGFQLKADVDSLKENLGPPGSLPVIQFKIEQLSERVERVETILKQEDQERNQMREVIRSGQQKVDMLIELLKQERERAREPNTEPSDVSKLESRLEKYFDRNNGSREWSETEP